MKQLAALLVLPAMLAAASCAKTTLAPTDFSQKCAKNSDCVVVYVGDECNQNCIEPSAVNVQALSEVTQAIDAAKSSCLPELVHTDCTSKPPAVLPTCEKNVCNEAIVPHLDPSDPRACPADGSACTGTP